MNREEQSRENPSAEAKILGIIDEFRQKGKFIPKKVSEIPGLPFSSFESLITDLNSGNVVIQRFVFEYATEIFNILATPLERKLLGFYPIVAFGVPLVSIVLVIFHSWWWLLGLLSLPVFMPRNKALYNRVIFRSALQSEPVFCFLYYTRQVCITTSDYMKSYYWKDKETDLKDA